MNLLFNNLNTNPYINVYTVGYEKTKPNHSYGPVRRSGYMLHYVYSGEGVFKCNNKIYKLKQGDFFFISPKSIISYTSDSKDPWAYYWFGFRGKLVENYLEYTSINSDNPIFTNSTSNQRIRQNMSKLIEVSLVDEHNDILLNSYLLKIIYYLQQYYPKNVVNTNKISPDIIFSKAASYMQHNYENTIKINDLSNLLNIDRTYLHRLFLKYSNTSPKQYLTNLRIEKAKSLLIESNLSIKTISFSVGFDDSGNFSKLFKLLTGTTPTEYRHKNRI